MSQSGNIRHSPFPEILPEDMGRGWKIEERGPFDNAGTDLLGKRMSVPMGESDWERNVRLHEMMHAAITKVGSPDKLAAKYRVTPQALQAAEDMRVNGCLTQMAKLSLEAGLEDPRTVEEFEAALKRMMETPTGSEEQESRKIQAVVRACTLALVSRVHTGDIKRIGPAISRVAPQVHKVAGAIVNGAYNLLYTGRPDRGPSHAQLRQQPRWSRVVKVAEYIDKLTIVAVAMRDGSPEEFDPEETGWGRMDYEEPPRLHTARFLRAAPVVKSMDSGHTIRRLERMLTDGKVFGIKLKRHGGSVLIDTSGSMHLKPEQVLQIIESAPHATVALYGGMENAESGVLRVVVKDGKACDRSLMDRAGEGNNTIDGPALRWLAKQDEPRLWVSDGQVTGRKESQGAMLRYEVEHLCKQNRIRRVSVPEDVAKTFKLMQKEKKKFSVKV